MTVATPHWENDPAGRRCGRCAFWGLPYARAVGYCGREGNPYGDEQTGPHQGCGLFEAREGGADPAALPACQFCGGVQTEPGALVFGPPGSDARCVKLHCCTGCWPRITALLHGNVR